MTEQEIDALKLSSADIIEIGKQLLPYIKTEQTQDIGMIACVAALLVKKIFKDQLSAITKDNPNVL